MASAESENAQPFKFAERHQAVVLHPTASVDDDMIVLNNKQINAVTVLGQAPPVEACECQRA